MGEREVKFRDVLWFSISHWRILIIFLILGIILGGAYSFFRTNTNNSESPTNRIERFRSDDIDSNQILDAIADSQPEEGISTIVSSLTDVDRRDISIYYSYADLFNRRKAYSDNLDYMRLDPYNTYEGLAVYYIEAASFDSLNPVLAIYKTKLNELVDKYGTLLSFSTEVSGIEDAVIDSNDNLQFVSPNATLQITVQADSKESCEDKLEEIDAFIRDVEHSIDSSPVQYDIRKIASSYYKLQETKVADWQKNNIDALNTLSNSMNSTYKNMSARAMAFVEYIKEYPELDWEKSLQLTDGYGSDEYELDDNTNTGQGNSITQHSISPKWVALGAVIGLVIAFFILAIVYCSSNKVHFEDDYESMLKIPCLGRVDSGKKKKTIIDRAIEKARFKTVHIIKPSDSAEMIAANILVCSSDKKINKLWATGTVFSESNRQFASNVSSVLKTKEIDMTVGHTMFDNAAEIENMGKIGSVVLFESVSESYNKNVVKAIQSCINRGIKVLGIVVIGN